MYHWGGAGDTEKEGGGVEERWVRGGGGGKGRVGGDGAGITGGLIVRGEGNGMEQVMNRERWGEGLG